jgi:hypothetical protein
VQQLPPMLREEGLGVELNPPDRRLPVSHRLDLADPVGLLRRPCHRLRGRRGGRRDRSRASDSGSPGRATEGPRNSPSPECSTGATFPCIRRRARIVRPPNASPSAWWPRHTPRRGMPRGVSARMASTLMPASPGVQGPGEISIRSGGFGPELLHREGVVAHHLGIRAQLAQELDQVPGERVVVVENEKHGKRWRSASEVHRAEVEVPDPDEDTRAVAGGRRFQWVLSRRACTRRTASDRNPAASSCSGDIPSRSQCRTRSARRRPPPARPRRARPARGRPKAPSPPPPPAPPGAGPGPRPAS